MTRETVLITGATGFIGSHVVEALLSQGSYSVLAITRGKRNDRKIEALNQKGATVVEGEFHDPILLEKLFRENRIHHVIHLAAIRGTGGGAWNYYYNINVLGTQNLLGASLKNRVRRFIFCSSVGVYGTVPKDCPANLGTPLNGDNHYHRSKIQAEKKVEEFIQKGLDAYILRPSITYGPGQTGFPKSLASLVRNRILLLPSGDIKIHLLDVRAFSELIIKILEVESWTQRTFIVADEEPISLRKLVDLIHFHYHKATYPSFLRLPEGVGQFLKRTFEFAHNEKWLSRMLLMSRDWHYDIHETIQEFHYVPTRTSECFVGSLHV